MSFVEPFRSAALVLSFSVHFTAAMAINAEAPRQDGPGTGAERPARDKDVAIAMVGEQSNTIDPAVAARAVRKTDWFLIPAMIVGCA